MEDGKILLLLKNRPSDGLYEAMDKYGGAARAVVTRVLQNKPEDIEECVADTFVNVWRAVERIDAEHGSLKGFILVTARNTAINRYNSLRRRQAVSLDELELPGDDDVVEMILEDEVSRELQQLILGMPDPDQEIFFRKYFLFEPVRDIARRLSLNEIQVKNRLYRGRQRLRKQLEERGISCEAIS